MWYWMILNLLQLFSMYMYWVHVLYMLRYSHNYPMCRLTSFRCSLSWSWCMGYGLIAWVWSRTDSTCCLTARLSWWDSMLQSWVDGNLLGYFHMGKNICSSSKDISDGWINRIESKYVVVFVVLPSNFKPGIFGTHIKVYFTYKNKYWHFYLVKIQIFKYHVPLWNLKWLYCLYF